MSEKKRELVAEADLGGAVDDTALKGLRTITGAFKQFGGEAELLYRDDGWHFRVFKQRRAVPPKTPNPTTPTRRRNVFKKPYPPMKFLEATAKKILAEKPDMAGKPEEVVKAMKEAVEKKGYRRTIDVVAKTIIKRLTSKAGRRPRKRKIGDENL